MSDAIDQNALYPIREVARLTGVNPITLRAWERRYNLIEPVRTESGHRLYTQEHINFLHETLRLMDEGIPISRIQAVISDAPSRQLLSATTAACASSQDALVEKVCLAVMQTQAPALERLLDRLFADYSLDALRTLLAQIDTSLQAHEHSAVWLAYWHTCVMRRVQVRLHSLYSQVIVPSKRVVIYSAEQTPEYLAALVTLFCFEQGYHAITLGNTVTLEQLFTLARPLSLQAVVVVDLHARETEQWSACFAKYALMRTWVFGDEKGAVRQPPSVNCELREWSQWFAPLSL